MPSKKTADPRSSAEPWFSSDRSQDRQVLPPPAAGPPDPAIFDRLLEIAVKRGVIEFEAGPFKVKFGPGVHAEWQRVNRPIVER